MDITVYGKATCPHCQKDYKGKLVMHLHEDSKGNMKTIPPLDESALEQEEVEITYDYGVVDGHIDGIFICPSCGERNSVRVEIPTEVTE